jgi:hypothetical protein
MMSKEICTDPSARFLEDLQVVEKYMVICDEALAL